MKVRRCYFLRRNTLTRAEHHRRRPLHPHRLCRRPAAQLPDGLPQWSPEHMPTKPMQLPASEPTSGCLHRRVATVCGQLLLFLRDGQHDYNSRWFGWLGTCTHSIFRGRQMKKKQDRHRQTDSLTFFFTKHEIFCFHKSCRSLQSIAAIDAQ